MRKRTVIVLSLIAAVMLVLIAEAWITQPQPVRQATWIWNLDRVKDHADLFSFLNKEHVAMIYVQVSSGVSRQDYRSFVKEAVSNGIEVHALGGSPEWAQAIPCSECDEFGAWIESYQSEAGPDEAFAGIHLDVEPYLLDDWDELQRIYVMNLQTLIEDFAGRSEHMGLQFGVDLPFWFDNVTYRNTYGEGNMTRWIIDRTDHIAVMAYRNEALGSNGIIRLAEQEIGWANEAGKFVVIAVETAMTGEEHVSFHSMPSHEMEAELAKVKKRFDGEPAFWGIAIHHLEIWMKQHAAP